MLGLVECDEIGGKIGTQRGYKTHRLQIHIDIPQLAPTLIFFLLDPNKNIDAAILAQGHQRIGRTNDVHTCQRAHAKRRETVVH